MIKRVSCRVISSVPFGQTGGRLSSVRLPNNPPDEINYVTKPKYNSNSGHNIKAFNIDLGTVDGFPIGQILDYCA
ncbi:MAG: hypothetical protein ABR969_07355 [Sedimentisphaerales bacterium]